MHLKDMHNNIHLKRAISPVSSSDNTALVSQIIDMQGYGGLMFAIMIGSVADADTTVAVLVEDGDVSNLSDAAAVADEELQGTEALAGFQFDDDNEPRKIGYRGVKRYVRLTITPTGNASAMLVSAVALLSPDIKPAANPPV